MMRRLSLAFAFFSVLSAVAVPALASVQGCMFRCGAEGVSYASCSRICQVGTTQTK